MRRAAAGLRRERGMTVVELVVGLTITALALAAGHATLGTLVDQRARVREEAAETVRAAAVRRAVADWLGGAYAAGTAMSPPFQLVDRRDRGRADDELSFLTTARTPVGAGGGVVVRLFVDRDARTPERGLTAEFSDWTGTRAERLELDSSVVALDVRCLSAALGRREWMGGWSSSLLLPQGVRLSVAAASPERLTPLLRVPISARILGGR
jgi:hypothetical protein